MLVELRTLMAGPDGVRGPGVHQIPDDEAESLIAGGFARPVDVSPADEPVEGGSAPADDVPPAVIPEGDEGLDGDGFVEVTVTGKRAKR